MIDCFTRQKTWSLAELAAALGQSKPTVFRILHTIEAFGYLQSDPETGRYALAMRFHTLGSAAVRHEQLRWQALPPLQDLARETGETVHVGILYDGEAICVQAVDGTRLVRMHAFVGKRTPAHASALGKVLLAHLPDAEVDALADRGLARFTPHTITDAGGAARGAAPGPRARLRAGRGGDGDRGCAVSARRSPITPAGPARRSPSRRRRRAWTRRGSRN